MSAQHFDPLSIYIHVPFCTRKCPYCHFYVIPDRLKSQEQYSLSLQKEWKILESKRSNKQIISLYLGGGTPSLLDPKYLQMILGWFQPLPSEVTLEVNPETVDLEQLKIWKKLGINRLSFGVQSFDDRALESLERTHSASQAKKAIFWAEEAGFSNISIDLMYDLPHQTLASFSYTLDSLKDLPIHHVSLYNLTIEPNTPFFKQKPPQPDTETSLQLHLMALKRLDQLQFTRYELSAFAKNNRISIHNSGYWTGRPFLGLGPSAFSYFNQTRYRNIASLSRYAKALEEDKSPVDFEETLLFPQNLLELLVIRLRMMEGVSLEELVLLPEQTQYELQALQSEGLLIEKKKRLTLSESGALFYDSIAERLI